MKLNLSITHFELGVEEPNPNGRQLLHVFFFCFSVPVLAESDTHTGIIIGVMTSIIVALALALAIIISRSVHNVRQTVGRSVLSPPFGRTNPVI